MTCSAMATAARTAAPESASAGLVLLVAHLCVRRMADAAPAVRAVGRARQPASAGDDPRRPGERAADRLDGSAAGCCCWRRSGCCCRWRRGRWTRPLSGTWPVRSSRATCSAAIALVQTGVPGQVVNVDSVLLNTAGVALAACWSSRCCAALRAGGAGSGSGLRAARAVRGPRAPPLRPTGVGRRSPPPGGEGLRVRPRERPGSGSHRRATLRPGRT